jgi:hypothetical protein
VDIAALLALIAALMSGVGDVIRQRSAQEITDEHVGHVELLRMSLRDVRWWLGGFATGGTVLGETLCADGPEMVALVGAVVSVVVATTALARGEAATMTAEEAVADMAEAAGYRQLVTALEIGTPVAAGLTSRA